MNHRSATVVVGTSSRASPTCFETEWEQLFEVSLTIRETKTENAHHSDEVQSRRLQWGSLQ